MTQELDLIFETQIANVAHCASSIFSREDVIIMLKTIRQSINDLPDPEHFTKKYILDTLEEALNDFDYDEFTTFEPELQGAYGSSWSLEINHSFDDIEFKRCLLTDVENYFNTNN